MLHAGLPSGQGSHSASQVNRTTETYLTYKYLALISAQLI